MGFRLENRENSSKGGNVINLAKYRITDESMEYNGCVLWRIECLRTRRKGGWIQSESNLSQAGEAWVGDNAKVYGEATIMDNAVVHGNAEVFGAARIAADAQVYGNAIVADFALVTAKAQVYGEASIEDSAQISGHAKVSGKALVSACAKVYEYATIEGAAQVYDHVEVYGHAKIKDRAYLFKEAHVKGHTVVSSNDRISENIYNWEDINALTLLKITLVDGKQTGQLYANGRHQLAVKITMEARDRMNKPIVISPKEMFEQMELVDDENNSISNGLLYVEEAGMYVYPKGEETRPVIGGKTSAVMIYCSIDKPVKAFTLSVRCKIKQWSNQYGMERVRRVEYTTAKEYNYGGLPPDFVRIQVLPKRQFTQSNIQVQTRTELDVNGICNSKLTKYYVQFNPADGLILLQTNCIAKKWFHYKQMGIYKRCSIATDGAFTVDDQAIFTTKFEFTSSKFRKVLAKNHEMEGLCFWVYQLWEGLIWSYYEWGGEMYFSMFDQYGNEACITAVAGEEEALCFYVRLEELNHE
ncbi:MULTISPECIES: transferase [unclassified Myroides]|uniref:transferase n=1 Tax=unclassified Myroides TaxID=2642485 RepID=UPI003D2F96D3